MLQNIGIYYVFATLAPQKPPKRSILAIFGPTMSAARRLAIKIAPNLGAKQNCLKPDDARKGNHEPTVSTTLSPSHKVLRIIRAKAEKTPMCSVSLVAMELKGLAAPGEALKNK